MPTKLAT